MPSRVVWLPLVGLLACCHASPPSPPPADETDVPPALDAATPTASRTGSAAPPPAPPAEPAASVSRSAYSGRAFRCGAGRCSSGEQMCCTSTLCPGEASCRPIDWAVAGALPWWHGSGVCEVGVVSPDARATCPKLFAACGASRKGRCNPAQSQNVDPKSCDDSRDCTGAVCCTVGPGENAVCTTAAVCEGDELCQDDAGCRTPGTLCVSGKCKSTRARVACGGRFCSGATPVCQLPDWRVSYPPGKTPPPRCRAYSAPEAGSFYECASAGDCPDGQRCVWAQYAGDGSGEWNTTVCRFAATEGISPRTHTCAGDADCADVAASMGDGRPSRCKRAAVGPTCLSLCDDGSDQEEMVGLPFALAMARCRVK